MVHRQDAVFLLGILVGGCIYARNWVLARRAERGAATRGSPVVPVLLGLGVFLAVQAVLLLTGADLPKDEPFGPWLVLGFAGQGLWSSRFVVQWFASERLGRSVLPPSFFRISIVGSVVLVAYAIHRQDWVMTAAFVLNPVPYARNLVLLAGEARARRDGAARPDAP
jgi:lipid-A-disaccharide synthase-like uncharacterized protein